jgi:hypothetical protein
VQQITAASSPQNYPMRVRLGLLGLDLSIDRSLRNAPTLNPSTSARERAYQKHYGTFNAPHHERNPTGERRCNGGLLEAFAKRRHSFHSGKVAPWRLIV